MLCSKEPKFILYVPRPIPFADLENPNVSRALGENEAIDIMKNCSNDWRKIFSTFSKIIHPIIEAPCTWQNYRDQHLLQAHGNEALVFGPYLLDSKFPDAVHIIAGKNFYKDFELPSRSWSTLEETSNLHRSGLLFKTPYFDYRQFPNRLIDIFVEELKGIFRD